MQAEKKADEGQIMTLSPALCKKQALLQVAGQNILLIGLSARLTHQTPPLVKSSGFTRFL